MNEFFSSEKGKSWVPPELKNSYPRDRLQILLLILIKLIILIILMNCVVLLIINYF